MYHQHMDELDFDTTSHVYTPAELNREVKLHLEAGFARILLQAEISNLTRPASGHLYFTLKDQSAQVRCAMFRSAASRCSLQPKNGMQVIARGRISLYEPRGEYQFIADGLRDAGEGLLQLQFEALKKKLAADGLFDPARKQALPRFPRRIGVITSRSGAAIRDILHVLERRWPVARVRLYAVAVQGSEAPAEICAAIDRANREAWADLLILGRGGGSLEDLQAFNEEAVARRVAASNLPIISAVGHETDFSICDFVADLRAPTPSAAAELATPDARQINDSLSRLGRMLKQRMAARLQRDMQQLDYLVHRLRQRDPATRLREKKQRLERLKQTLQRATIARLGEGQGKLDKLQSRLHIQHPGRRLERDQQRVADAAMAIHRLLRHALERSRNHLQELARTLNAVSPLATIGRGYAVLSATAEGTLVTRAGQRKPGDRITAQLSDGRLYCRVETLSGEVLETTER